MSRIVIQAGWDDVPHITEEMVQKMSKSMLPYQAEARRRGIPSLGSGAIYPIPEEDIVVDPFKLPDHFPRIYGMDVGWKRTAVIWGAWDREQDVVYLYSEHYRGQAEPSVHAAAVKARGSWIPGEIDYAGTNQADGTKMWELYKGLGLKVKPADKGVEAGIQDMYERLSTGRIKVFSTLRNWLAEYRIYRRDEKGRIVKQNDHLMDSTRYMIRRIQRARVRPMEQEIFMPKLVGDRTAGY